MPHPRRSFLAGSVAAAGAALLPRVTSGRGPGGRLHVACVGVDGIAKLDLPKIASHPAVTVVGLCDVDARRFAAADAAHPGVRHFADYREMLATLGDTLDAVIVDTPDHMHAPIAVAAMQAGKHVYCQKPLSHTLWEARQMRLWAEKSATVTQMGNQIHSSAEYRTATRLLRELTIGKVREVYSWAGVTGNERTRLFTAPAPAPVPEGLDWDLWIGAAPMRDYAPAYHPFTWRDWQDFGGGALGDFGCHILDPVFTGLGLSFPRSVQARNSGANDEIWPTQETVKYVFPGTRWTAGESLKVTWMDGGLKPAESLARMPGNVDLPGAGSLFIGEDGCMVLPHVGMPRLYPVEKYGTAVKPSVALPTEEARNHWHDWVNACLSGTKTTDGFDYAGPLTETVHLGNIATLLARPVRDPLTGRLAEPGPLDWDAVTMRFSGPCAADADRLVSKGYRNGFAVTAAEQG